MENKQPKIASQTRYLWCRNFAALDTVEDSSKSMLEMFKFTSFKKFFHSPERTFMETNLQKWLLI